MFSLKTQVAALFPFIYFLKDFIEASVFKFFRALAQSRPVALKFFPQMGFVYCVARIQGGSFQTGDVLEECNPKLFLVAIASAR